MDCNCNCFGIAASSKRPIKRYNLLVPDIFPRSEPTFTDKVDSSTERKIKKLGDYLEKNPHRGPKVKRLLEHGLAPPWAVTVHPCSRPGCCCQGAVCCSSDGGMQSIVSTGLVSD